MIVSDDLQRLVFGVGQQIVVDGMSCVEIAQYGGAYVSKTCYSQAWRVFYAYLSIRVDLSKGLSQGCSIFFIIFNLYIECPLDDWRGIIHGVHTLNAADDQFVMAQDIHDFEFRTEQLVRVTIALDIVSDTYRKDVNKVGTVL